MQKDLINQNLNLNLEEKETYEDVFNHIKHSNKSINSIDRLLKFYFSFYLQDDILTKADRASMYNSLEVRAPFLDKDFIEYVAPLSPDLKLHNFTTKYIFKKSIAKHLPKNIINRPKKGFGIPVAKWLKSDLKPMMTDLLSSDHIKSQGIFNPLCTEKLINEHLKGKKDNRKLLWTLITFQLWHEKFISG